MNTGTPRPRPAGEAGPATAGERVALAPDPETLTERGLRAWTEPMAVHPHPSADIYIVDSASGARYIVDPGNGVCDCPDARMRGGTCKHLRRVAIEITAGRVAPPGRRSSCPSCGAATDRGGESLLCEDCALAPGEVVLDRETGDRLIVVGVTSRRADEFEIDAADTTVAEYPTNEGYPAADVVVETVYVADAARQDDPQRYAFPRARLGAAGDATFV